MPLTSSVESQAVLGLLFFSPSAATLCRGTPDPTQSWRSGSAHQPARPQPGQGPVLGPGLVGDVPGFFRSMVAWGCGPDRGRVLGRAGPGPGPTRSSGVSTTGRGGRLRGFPTSGCRAPLTLFSPTRVFLLLSLLCFRVSVALTNLRGLRGAGRGRTCCLNAFARLSGSLVASRGYGCSGLQPFLCSEQCAGLGRARAVGFIAGRSRWA